MRILAILIIAAALAFSGCGKEETANFDAFAQCLTEKNVVMYGAEWCPHCQEQKKLFGKSFQYVHYVDCDKQRNACIEAGIESYPTWVINSTYYTGVQPV